MGNSLAKAVFSFKTNILNPKLNRLHQKTKNRLKEPNLEKYNLEKRQELIHHAITNSTFYTKKYGNLNLPKNGTLTQEDFLKIPPLTRTELVENFENIKVKNVSSIAAKKVSTSGSTGHPISILRDLRNPETPIRWRILNWWGIEPWENQAFIYRYKRPFSERISNALLWWPTKRIFLAAANPTKEHLEKFVTDFNSIKPSLLQGYVDVVFEFALYLLDNNIKIHPPKMVWVTSAPLFEEQRELMQKAFGAPVCDQYGNTEIMLIAAECPEQKGLHIMQDTVHIEFVDQNNEPVPPNTIGRILLTDLTNYAFPLIRYDIGDEGKFMDEMCSCGKQLPLMENVRGRQAHNIQTPSGLRIRGEHLMAMFNGHMKNFKEIQLRQEADYSVSMEYVPRGHHNHSKEIQNMAELIMQRSRQEIKVYPKEVQKIQQVGRKTPLIVSNLK
ncbi:phenylacetate--CoA ligase family protein [Cellulophaga baltica]|uniref:Phenylacetate-CoA ligase n=1 Tax=Cellulophaga baltica TaxID=76594 RepID=A0A1G7H6L1_9FLAO|nr:phenylacetate--CoA ligase family protein [Cellulophaga baltica]SDE96077.1 phenylacetate-CoA ligase [Cellulophaga baltica]